MLDYDDIIKDDNPNLRLKSKPVAIPLSEENLLIMHKLNQYLVSSLDSEYCEKNNIRPGIGLAAPQIDKQLRMFVILTNDEKGKLFHYGIINPRIISHSEEKTFLPSGEGCLSVDYAVEGLVHRYRRITVEAFFYDFKTKALRKEQRRLRDYIAIVFQHEFDHLNGILFYDHINKDNPFFIPKNSTPIKYHSDTETKEQ